jgi:hypothetical protein
MRPLGLERLQLRLQNFVAAMPFSATPIAMQRQAARTEAEGSSLPCHGVIFYLT